MIHVIVTSMLAPHRTVAMRTRFLLRTINAMLPGRINGSERHDTTEKRRQPSGLATPQDLSLADLSEIHALANPEHGGSA